MTIRIEVTGDSLPEVADKLLALGRGLSSQASYEADNAAREALQAKRSAAPRKTKKAEPETEQEDVGNGQTGETQSPAEHVAEQASAETGRTAPDVGASASDAQTLDFDKEVAPVVIDAVQRLGKPAVSALLSEFGVERASEVDPSLYGELVDRLKAL